MEIKTFNPKEMEVPALHHLLLGAVGPRPICFASTVDEQGNRNLAPFSFFNVFSANPPIVVFSPAKSGKTGADKHTYENAKATKEVVINIVNYAMVNQMSLASSPYPKGVDEFIKAGFTAIKSDIVKPDRVAESPVQMECKVNQIITLGDKGGAGNLIIAEVLKIHVAASILLENNHIDQTKIDLVARMGDNFYCRAFGDALFEISKPMTTLGIGVDALPTHIKETSSFSKNHLGMLGSAENMPNQYALEQIRLMNNSYEERAAHALLLLAKNEYEQALEQVWEK